MNRLCFLAFAFSFIATAVAAPLLPVMVLPATNNNNNNNNTSNVVKFSAPEMVLCDAIQELEHDICGNAATAVMQTPLCRVLFDLNSTLCSSASASASASAVNVNDAVAHPDGTMCPLLIFIDEVLCSNATAAGVVAAAPHPNNNKINPAAFCPIIELADKELCGGWK